MRESIYKTIRRYDGKWWPSGPDTSGYFTYWTSWLGYDTERESNDLCTLLNSVYVQGSIDRLNEIKSALEVDK